MPSGGVSPGVVGMSEVIQPNASNMPKGLNFGTPATWSMVWVGIAVFILMFLHLALIGRAAR